MKSLLAVSAIALLSLSHFRPSQAIRAASGLPPCPNPFPHEPVVLYEVTGGTLLGSVDSYLSVYNDGSARLSSFVSGNGPGSSQFAVVPPTEVQALRHDLIEAGALGLCDLPDILSDVPLATLTLFRAGPNAGAHTLSWFSSVEDAAEIEALLQSFIAEHFAALTGGGGGS